MENRMTERLQDMENKLQDMENKMMEGFSRIENHIEEALG